MKLNERIEIIQKYFKLNSSQLAKKANVTPQTIINIREGVTTNPKMNVLVNISNELKINPTWLITGSGSMILDEPESDCEKKLRRYEEELSVLREEVKILNKMQAVLYKKIDFLTKNSSKKE